MSAPIFLTAEWKSLLMINYRIDPHVLAPFIPAGTELDLWEGEALISLVGFLFLNTRVLGVPVPFHRNFEEVNLRFYVRRETPKGPRRGVVFIREIVPRLFIALVARLLYNEAYAARPMRHRVASPPGAGTVEYQWRSSGRWDTLAAEFDGDPQPMAAGSPAEFIFEHYWGYTRQRDGGTVEYEVRHPRWNFWTARNVRADLEIKSLYGAPFVPALSAEPVSAFVAVGSGIEVRKGIRVA